MNLQPVTQNKTWNLEPGTAMIHSHRSILGMTTVALLVLGPSAFAQLPASPILEGHEGDDYTRYELLTPDSAQFKIVYEVTATKAGARFYFNPIRKGSIATDEAVYDVMTGQPLKFEVVSGTQAKAAGQENADVEGDYIQVTLPRAVPADGEIRLRIDKTYKDAKSYFREGDLIVFSRSLGIRRNAVVLPAGYELVACNHPSQIVDEADGRIRVSFLHTGAGPVPFVIKGRLLPPAAAGTPSLRPATEGHVRFLGPPVPVAGASGATAQAPAASSGPSMASRLNERAHQDREIVYFLQQPDTHAFSLYHDYTESRPGVDKYLNVVRAGSKASNPSARLLDTGEALKVETLRGAQIKEAGIDIGEPIQPDSEVVVIRFPPVQKGQSVRLRIIETYADPGRYYMAGDQFVWDRSLGRPRNAVVMPAGWFVTASSIPATVRLTSDGRIRLDYDNPRPGEVDVLLKGKRRGADGRQKPEAGSATRSPGSSGPGSPRG